jgi:hypothetical protein
MAREDSQPILPARPTDNAVMAAPRPSIWRHWPIIVMSVAVVAIVIAVVVLVWPSGSTRHAQKLPPPPAPERMETDPLPTQPAPVQPPQTGQVAPWNGRGAPPAQVAPRPTPDPLPADPPDDTDALDQLSQLGGAASATPDLLFEVAQHACSRAIQCTNTPRDITLFCATLNSQARGPSPACAAKQRCIERVEATDCSRLRSLQSVLLQLSTIPECLDAMTRC